MVTATILITGGLIVAGTRILLKRRQVRTPTWLIQPDGSRVKSYAVIVESDEVTALSEERAIKTNYTLSTLSLGLNLASTLLFDPVKWLGLPLDIYNLGVIIEHGFSDLRRSAQMVVIVVVTITLMISGQALLISSIQWIYFFSRKFVLDVQKHLRTLSTAERATAT
ncbi:hypothetical protein [Candidatus Chloroploca sp. Khr17]|uniref:hypothetical protein n=1 Tax=Candidatus Chloroploca sp. Khr17 TaxID=2496869 RepID=UPI00101CABBE|nr:hypothetical protein [Candidatus Chloroploca sp. Khr17]